MPAKTDTTVVTVDIDRNLFAPKMTQGEWVAKILETQDLGMPFARVEALDEDQKARMLHFLAPPAESQPKGSGAFLMPIRPSSVVVVVNFSLKILISQKLPDNFFSFLVYSFLRKVPIYCINIDLIESS